MRKHVGSDENGFQGEESDLPEKVAGWFMQKAISRRKKNRSFEQWSESEIIKKGRISGLRREYRRWITGRNEWGYWW